MVVHNYLVVNCLCNASSVVYFWLDFLYRCAWFDMHLSPWLHGQWCGTQWMCYRGLCQQSLSEWNLHCEFCCLLLLLLLKTILCVLFSFCNVSWRFLFEIFFLHVTAVSLSFVPMFYFQYVNLLWLRGCLGIKKQLQYFKGHGSLPFPKSSSLVLAVTELSQPTSPLPLPAVWHCQLLAPL